MSSISSLTDIDELDIDDSEIDDMTSTAAGPSTTGAATAPPITATPTLLSITTHIDRDALAQLTSDPLRPQRLFDNKYKPMKIKPKAMLLESSQNYTQWSRRVTSILTSQKIASIVINGAIPAVTASDQELDTFSLMQQDGMLVINMTVSERILDTMPIEDPHLVWKHLKSLFFRDSPYNFVIQQYNLYSLHSKVDVNKPLMDHIERYEAEYAKLLTWMRNSQNSFYNKEWYGVLVQDEAKKNLLLSALVPHNPLLVDNLMSNQQLTYEDCKNHLCTLPSSQYKERNSGKDENVRNGSMIVEKAMVASNVTPSITPTMKETNSRRKQGRKQGDDPLRGIDKSDARIAKRCFHCHKLGHNLDECWWKKNEDIYNKDNTPGKRKAGKEKAENEKALVVCHFPSASGSGFKIVKPF